MPIYEYQCKKCGKEFEFQQSIKDSPKKKCPACEGKLTKLISNTSFQLKGTGWYVTDFAGKKPAKEETTKKEEPTKKQETKTEKITPKINKKD